jgi:magnesium transporter
MAATQIQPWDVLRDYLNSNDTEGLTHFLSGLSGEESLRAFMRLDNNEQQQVLERINPVAAAEVIAVIPAQPAAGLLEELNPQLAASIVSEMSSSSQADLLGDLDVEDLEEILRYMDERDALGARQLMAYDDHVAGGLMVTEYFSYPRMYRTRAVLNDLQRREEEYELNHVLDIYVTGHAQQLLGLCHLRDIALATPDTRLADIYRPALSVRDTATLEELEHFFSLHHLSAVPVVDDGQRMLGVLRRRAVFDALSKESEAAYLKSRGIVGGEELRSMPTLLRSRRRLSWLTVNILLNVIAASVIAQFQDVLSAVIVLAVFLPIISDMSGCSGNQAVAVSMRELSLGVIKPQDFYYVWRKEVAVGLINGLVLGLLIALVALVWQGNPWLGLVVGFALSVNTLIAVSIGGTVPVLLKRFKVDPAVASGPILTTITDMCGFFLLLGSASLMLPYLTGNA